MHNTPSPVRPSERNTDPMLKSRCAIDATVNGGISRKFGTTVSTE